ncbi:MAG: hypothetical protein PHP37_03395 [Patescibacteria group bacterium]|nr:hypothetical protein [Patescibacteria group bacterium]
MKTIKFRNIITFFFYLIFFLLLLKNSLAYLDPDFGWHLKVGQEIALNKKVPTINHYNYVLPINENFWVDHEWLSDYLLFLAYDNWGYIFINIFFALIIILIFLILNNFISKEIIKDPKSIYFLLIIETLGLKAMSPHFGVRIQAISLLFLSLLLIIIYYFEKKALTKKRQYYQILFLLIPLLYLWANLHAGFLLGIFLLFLYLGVKIVERILLYFQNKKIIKPLINFFNLENTLNNKNIKIFLLFALLASASTTLTPYGLKLFDFLYSYGNTAYLKIISEWLPQYYWPFMYLQLLYIGLILTGLIITLFFYKNYRNDELGKKLLTPWNIALNILFIILAIKSKRHFPLLFVSSLPFIATFVYHDFKLLLNTKNNKKNKKISVFIKCYLLILFITVSTIITISIKIIKEPFNYFHEHYPRGATDFLKENHEKYYLDNLFNSYNWGGYLIHEHPERKLFIDGRLPQKELNGHSYIEEYYTFYSEDQTKISEKIEKYDIKLFLLEKPKDIKLHWIDKKIFRLKEDDFKAKDNLVEYLNNNNFNIIYEDEISVIYYQE